MELFSASLGALAFVGIAYTRLHPMLHKVLPRAVITGCKSFGIQTAAFINLHSHYMTACYCNDNLAGVVMSKG